MAKILVCESILKPRIIQIPSSTGTDIYEVIGSTIYNDPVCDCKGFQFRGTCKHVVMVEQMHCEYHRLLDAEVPDSYPADICPMCGSKLVEFDLEPELE